MAMQSRFDASANSERIWREQLVELVSRQEIDSLSKPSLVDTFASIGALWFEVAVLITAANLLPRLPLGWAVPAGVVLVLLLGLRMNAFGVVLHEGSHGLLAGSRRLTTGSATGVLLSGPSTRSRSTVPPTASTIAIWDRSATRTAPSTWCRPVVAD